MFRKFNFIILLSCMVAVEMFAQEKIELWPGKVPGEVKSKAADVFQADRDNNVTRISEVTNPVLEVFAPKPINSNGIGMIVCPGGGYGILAIDKEGYEIAQWLTEHGFTVFLLHYRVPQKKDGALQDAQRAMRIVRSKARNYALNKIGIMGFSAGGSLSARLSTRYAENLYEKVSDIDTLSARPDFAALIYPAYLDQGENRSLTPELKLDQNTPPMFLFETADDPYGNSALVMAGALRDAKVPVELHYLPFGGHGYGLRPVNDAAKAWPELLLRWIGKL